MPQNFRIPKPVKEDLSEEGSSLTSIIIDALEAYLPEVKEGELQPTSSALMDEEYDETSQVSFRSNDLEEEIEEVAGQYGVEKSQVIRTCLERYLKQSEQGSAQIPDNSEIQTPDEDTQIVNYLAEYGPSNSATLVYVREEVLEECVPPEITDDAKYVINLRLQRFRDQPKCDPIEDSEITLLQDAIENFSLKHPLPYDHMANIFDDAGLDEIAEEFREIAAYLDSTESLPPGKKQ